MNLLNLVVAAVGCLFIQQPLPACTAPALANNEPSTQSSIPEFNGNSIDVALTSSAALVWDVKTNELLYEKNIDEKRPVASLTKLVTVLTVRSHLQPEQVIVIPPEVSKAQRSGAHIKLPAGEHARVDQLLAASLIASANDAAVALATVASETEEKFAQAATKQANSLGMHNTKLSNATGLSGGDQYSTARDIATAMKLVYGDQLLRPYLSQSKGLLITTEGSRRSYDTTNELLGTYVPILAAKTGFTNEAGENLAIITYGPNGQQIGAVILGSQQRFQDMKSLVEWIWRNYSWPA